MKTCMWILFVFAVVFVITVGAFVLSGCAPHPSAAAKAQIQQITDQAAVAKAQGQAAIQAAATQPMRHPIINAEVKAVKHQAEWEAVHRCGMTVFLLALTLYVLSKMLTWLSRCKSTAIAFMVVGAALYGVAVVMLVVSVWEMVVQV